MLFDLIRKHNSLPEDVMNRIGGQFQFAAEMDKAILSKAWEDENGRFIEGYASTKVMDSYDDIVEPTAFESTREEFFKYGGPLLYGHGSYDGLAAIPVGKVLPDHFTIDNMGLRIRAQIAETSQGNDVWQLIQLGVLKSFSIGFMIKKYEMDQETDIRTITDLRLYEISVVTIPANPETLFSVVSEKGFDPESVEFKSLINKEGDERGGPQASTNIRKEKRSMGTVENTELTRLATEVADHKSALDNVSGLPERVTELQQKMTEGINAIGEKMNQEVQGLATKAEVQAFTEKVSTDLQSTATELQKGLTQLQNAVDVQRRKAVIGGGMREYRKLLPGNRDREDLDILLHTPVDYNKSVDGELLKAIHDLHDAKVFMDKFGKHRSEFSSGASVMKEREKISESLNDLIKLYDPSIDTKAFSTGTSSYGSDWAVAVPSPEMFDLYDLEMVIEREFRHFNLTGKTNTYPLKTARGHAYTASTAASNNPDRYTKTNITTSSITFTPKKMCYAIVADEEGIEGDSIVQVVPVLREDMAYGLANGMDDALLNGDNSATHMDTGLTSDTTYTRDAFKGLRKLAVDDSKTFTCASTTTGVGDATTAFAALDVRYLRELCGKHGVKPSTFRYAVPINVFFKILGMAQFNQPGTYGAGASWLTGYLNNVDGCPLLICENMRSDLTTLGIYDGSTTTDTGLLGFDNRGFVIGDRRELTVEFEKDIWTGQWGFVGSIRKDFQKVVPSTEYPVAYGYAITT